MGDANMNNGANNLNISGSKTSAAAAADAGAKKQHQRITYQRKYQSGDINSGMA